MSKSRGKTPNNAQNAAPATTQNAIIPGKFFENDWHELLEIEDDENFISDIIDEITDAACNQIFDNIIKSRVQPHTILAAREMLLDIIEWNFLQSDPGEYNTNEDLSWIEDDEPCECIIDNWAQGAVPKTNHKELEKINELNEKEGVVSALQSLHIDSNDTEEEDDTNFLNFIVDDDSQVIDDIMQGFDDITIDDRGVSCLSNETYAVENRTQDGDGANDVSTESIQCVIEKQTKQSKVKKKSKKYRPHVGSLPNFEKISLESVTDLRPKPGTRLSSEFEDSSELLVCNQYGRASGPKEVVYDEKGQVVKVQKLNVLNFPKHRVPVKYSIHDTTENETSMKLHTGKLHKNIKQHSTDQNILNKNKINAKTLLKKIHPSSPPPPFWGVTSLTSDINGNTNGDMMNGGCMPYSLEPRSPLPPLMVDSMNVTDGVTIREGGLSKQVIRKSTHATPADNRTLYPIATSNNRVLKVKDIVSETSPTFKYITTAAETYAGM